MTDTTQQTMLTPQQGEVLVRLARQRIEEQLGVQPERPVTAAELDAVPFCEQRGVFVTLHKREALRGCIGSLTPAESVADGIRRHALNAAFHDHRFPPLTAAELPTLHVEVSVLTPPAPLEYTSGEQLARLLRPDVDGVILQGPGGESATFLPQVWRQLPATEQFLGHLCRKAGLTEDAWRAGTLRVWTYAVQSFAEPRVRGEAR